MAKATVNTNGGFDTAFLILFLFFFFVKVSELLGSLWERIDSRLLESDLPRESMATGVMFLAAILLLLLVQRKVMSKIIGAGNYEVARAAIMAVIGALVLFVPCCVSIILGLALLAGFLAPGIAWLFALIIVISLFISFGVAGFWTGWRFGKLGLLLGNSDCAIHLGASDRAIHCVRRGGGVLP